MSDLLWGPIDIRAWRAVPHITGRVATEADVRAGSPPSSHRWDPGTSQTHRIRFHYLLWRSYARTMSLAQYLSSSSRRSRAHGARSWVIVLSRVGTGFVCFQSWTFWLRMTRGFLLRSRLGASLPNKRLKLAARVD